MRSAVAIAGAAALFALLASGPTRAAPPDPPPRVPPPDLLFPRPASIQERVELWTRVYAEVDTNGGLIHDAEDLGVVYEVIRWPKSISGGDEEDRIGRAKAHYVAVLKRLASGKTGLTPEERRVLALFPPGVSRDTLLGAADRVRFQRGLADRFRDGLIRSGQWMPHIRKVFRDRGLPEDLAMLPHVESSFNPLAYSKVGAAGLWQFMPSTGARYMRIDRAVDERYDPWRASEAAAALMRDNFRVTGTWPLAITSYNHGAGGMMRAVKQLGTQDIGLIIDRYDSDTFGFASKNFYACFLAAGDVDRNSMRYFGAIQRERPAQFEEVVTRNPTSTAALVRTFGVDLGLLRELNLGLRDNVWSGRVAVPSGYALRVPRVVGRPPAEELAAALPKIEPPPPALANGDKHRVKRGETLASIARSYGVSAQALAQANKLRTTSKLKLGQTLRVPEEAAATAQASKPTPSKASARKAAKTPVIAAADPPPRVRSYTVKNGETLSSIARKSGIPVTKLAEANGMPPSARVKAGQKLRIPSASGG